MTGCCFFHTHALEGSRLPSIFGIYYAKKDLQNLSHKIHQSVEKRDYRELADLMAKVIEVPLYTSYSLIALSKPIVQLIRHDIAKNQTHLQTFIGTTLSVMETALVSKALYQNYQISREISPGTNPQIEQQIRQRFFIGGLALITAVLTLLLFVLPAPESTSLFLALNSLPLITGFAAYLAKEI